MEWLILFAIKYSISETIFQEILGWGDKFFSPHVAGGWNKNANVYQVYTGILVSKRTLTSTKATRDRGRTLGLQKSIPLSLSTRLL